MAPVKISTCFLNIFCFTTRIRTSNSHYCSVFLFCSCQQELHATNRSSRSKIGMICMKFQGAWRFKLHGSISLSPYWDQRYPWHKGHIEVMDRARSCHAWRTICDFKPWGSAFFRSVISRGDNKKISQCSITCLSK